MKYTYPRFEFRSSRTFVANLLAFVLLASQFAPLASAQTARGGARRAQQPEKANGAQPGKAERGTGGEKLSPGTVTPSAVAITATKTDNIPQATQVSPGATINYTVTITNNGSTAATGVAFNDTPGANTTLVGGSVSTQPIANPDTYNVIGNVSIVPNATQGLLANDCDPDNGAGCISTGLTASGPNSAPTHGQVTISSDGSFNYNPNPGYTGPDSFTYTVSDASGKTDTATATLTVSTPIWFVDDSAATGGDGRIGTPFNCYTGTTVAGGATCFSDTALDDPGDSVFLFAGNYTGGYALLNNEKLVGQGATASLASLHGVTVEAYSTPLPVIDSTPSGVVITTAAAATNAIPVSAGGILLRGFTVGSTTGAKIFGSAFGTLTVGNTGAPDVVLNGAGQALNLSNGTLADTSGFQSVTTTSSSGAGILLSQIADSGAGTVTFGSTTVSGSATQGILVQQSTADINFGNTAVGTATLLSGGTDAISLQNNSAGTRTFGTITTQNNSAVGFLHGVGGGAVSVTGATTITNPGGVGINIQNSNANLSFAATTVNKSSTAGTGVNLTGNTSRTISFSSLTVTTSNGGGLLANTGGSINTSGGSITTTGGPSLDLGGVTLGLNFTSLSSTNSGGVGLNLNATVGAITSGTTTIGNPAGAGMTIAGVTTGPYNFGNTSVTASGNTGVDLGSNPAAITFADLDINPDATRRAFQSANSTGTITTTSGDIQSTGNVALEITGANAGARTPLTMVLNNLDSTNSVGNGVELNFVSGNLTVNDAAVATNITNAGNGTSNIGIGIRVQNTAAGGTMNFGNTSVTGSGSTGVVLGTSGNGNAGAVTFGDLDITPDNGQRAFQATHNTGTVGTSSGTIASINATAVEITGQSSATRSPLNMVLTSISATASGGNPPNGIVLTNTNGPGASVGFSVLGDNSNTVRGGNATGGTIASTTGATGASGGIGIRLENADEVALRRMQLNDHPNFALYSLNASNVTVAFTTVSGTNGTNDGVAGTFFTDEAAVLFANMTGAALVDRCKISGGIENNMTVVNDTGTLNRLVIDDTEFGLNNTTLGADSLLIVASGLAANPASTVNVTIEDSDFLGARGDVIQTDFRENGKLDLIMERNDFSNAHTNIVSAGGGATFSGNGNALTGGAANFTYNIGGTAGNGNTFRGAKGTAVAIDMGTGVTQGRFRNNTIGVQAVANSGASDVGAGGFAYIVDPGGNNTVLIDNNQIFQYNNHGILLQVGDLQGIPTTTNMTVTNNLVSTPGTTAATNFNAIHLNSGTVDVPPDTTTSCVDILTNNVAAGAKGATLPNAADIRLRQRQSTTVRLPGYAGANNDNTAVANYLVARNTTRAQPNGAAASNTVGGAPAGGGYIGGAACTQPSNAPIAIGAGIAPPADLPVEAQTAARQQFIVPVAAPLQQTPAPFVGEVYTPVASRPVAAGIVSTAKADRVAATRAEGRETSLEKTAKSGKQIAAPSVAGTVDVQIGTLAPGDSVQITFSVTVNSPFPAGVTSVSNQGTVSGTGFSPVSTDDPDNAAGSADPTVTLVLGPPDVAIKDASTGEPASDSTQMAFTVTLSHAFNQNVTVNYATANGGANPATGGASCGNANVDYETTSGTLTFAPGQTVQSVSVKVCSDADTAETDETFLVNLSTPVNAVITDGAATGTIKAANTPGTILISEVRTSGPAGLEDDFVELYNNTDASVVVPAGGWGLFKMGASCAATPALIATIPAATSIPARGHYLLVGTQYSLTTTASSDQVFAQPLGEDSNVGLFSTPDVLLISSDNRLDAVGFGTNTGNNCDLLREGTTLPAATGSAAQHSFARKLTTGMPKDANDNAADFYALSTSPATSVGNNPTPILGAPGTENLASPIQRNAVIKSSLIDPQVSTNAPPNRVRSSFGANPTNAAFGTLSMQRRFKNTLGVNVTRLRFRIVDLTTIGNRSAGQSDLRVLSSTGVVKDSAGNTVVTVNGLTLEPPTQPNGGGLNSTLTVVLPGGGLAPGNTIDVQFLLGVQEQGNFSFFINVEALPGLGTIANEATGAMKAGTTAKERNADTGGAAATPQKQ
jgi:hypothetical protein